MALTNQSEIAQLRARIEAESVAASRALHDSMLGAAKHQFITARMENMERYQRQLCEIVGPHEALQTIINALDAALTPPQG